MATTSTTTSTRLHHLPADLDVESLVLERNLEYVTSLVPTLVYLVTLMLGGLAGNTLVFLVYYRRFKPSATRTYILAMSVTDLMTNCLALPSDIYEIRFHYDFDDAPGCRFFGFITRFLALQGALILIAIAVDRRRKICHKRAVASSRKMRHVYAELAGLLVFAVCYAVPFGVLRGLQTISVPVTTTDVDDDVTTTTISTNNNSVIGVFFNVTGTTCSIDDAYVGSLFFVIYNASMGLAFVICVILLAACYALIARHLWQHRKRLLANRTRMRTRAKSPTTTTTITSIFRGSSGLRKQRGEEREKEEGGVGECLGVGLGGVSVTEDSDVSGAGAAMADADNSTELVTSGGAVTSSSLAAISETDTCSVHPAEYSLDSSFPEPPFTPFTQPPSTMPTSSSPSSPSAEEEEDIITTSSAGLHTSTLEVILDDEGSPTNPSATTRHRHHSDSDSDSAQDSALSAATVTAGHSSSSSTNPAAQDAMTSAGTPIIEEGTQVNATMKKKKKEKDLREAVIVANATSRAHAPSKTTPAGWGKPQSKALPNNKNKNKSKNKNKKKNRPPGGSNDKKLPTRTTLMMFVLTATFVVSYLPYLSMAAIYRGRDLVGADYWRRNLHQVALRSFFINSAVNPLVYGFCSARFRTECCLFFRRKRR